jgi:hypothetical protein
LLEFFESRLVKANSSNGTLFSNDGYYIDIQQSHHIGGPYRTLTQDVSLYLVAISENANSDSLRAHEQQYSNHDGRITESTTTRASHETTEGYISAEEPR